MRKRAGTSKESRDDLDKISGDRFVFEEGAYRAYVTDEKTDMARKDYSNQKKIRDDTQVLF